MVEEAHGEAHPVHGETEEADGGACPVNVETEATGNRHQCGDVPTVEGQGKSKGKNRRKKVKFEKLEDWQEKESKSKGTLPRCPKTPKPPTDDIGLKAFNECAVENYARWWGLPARDVPLEVVANSSGGILAWAQYDGPGAFPKYEPPPISSSIPKQEIAARRRSKKELKRLHEFYATEAGEAELQRIADQRERKMISMLGYTKQSLSAVIQPDEWIEMELTADSGACDTVMPRQGLWSCIPISPSFASERGFEYEVANGAAIPCLGERKLEVWAEGASVPLGMTIQVADVHKPLLSLSRCADLGFESRLGKTMGYLIDSESGDTIPLTRRGNLYVLKVWVRQMKESAPPNAPSQGWSDPSRPLPFQRQR
jgi:hypothetical protein